MFCDMHVDWVRTDTMIDRYSFWPFAMDVEH